ncbi:radical SAM protein [uncultured Methanobrevibacter sp.]|uniref:radical SAM protein n=1 Tax=uncultured Methanobrevibacter sp. TaxID=253161 RepID=UPI002617A19E|nr:radical SAM protein [uncultured Methanobrevibacter sp.]
MSDSFDVQEYLADGVEYILKDAIKTSLKNPKEILYIRKFAKSARNATKTRQHHAENGQNIPAFLIASVTSSCNLHCTGCYSRANSSCSDDAPQNQLTDTEWEDIFIQAKELGISFIVLAGGEPLLREDIIKKASNHPEILFPIFTNGTMMDKSYLKLFDKNRNLVPVISIEGDENVTDSRRGEGVYEKVIDSMQTMKQKNIIFGASVTFTRANLSSIGEEAFISQLYDLGCRVLFFIEYVPVNKDTLHIAPRDDEREKLTEKIEHLRDKYSDMLFLSFPGDEKQSGGCLAAGRGFFHINSHGGAEPCPASPYSDINVRNTSLLEALNSKLFKSLREGGLLIDEHEGGCVLFDRQSEVERLLEK